MNAIFGHNDFQGEGSMAGVPLSILRVCGCPEGCDFCDESDARRSDDGIPVTLDNLKSFLWRVDGGVVMITGGEIMAMVDDQFCHDLLQLSSAVKMPSAFMLETGCRGEWYKLWKLVTACRAVAPVHVTISPKQLPYGLIFPLRATTIEFKPIFRGIDQLASVLEDCGIIIMSGACSYCDDVRMTLQPETAWVADCGGFRAWYDKYGEASKKICKEYLHKRKLSGILGCRWDNLRILPQIHRM